MKSLFTAARRGGIVSAAAMSALMLASCSGGQITQTSDQVAAVDGSKGETEDGNMAVRDVSIVLDPETDEAALKFTAVNQAYKEEKHKLDKVEVDGKPVQMDSVKEIGRDCRVVGESEKGLEIIPQAKESQGSGCIQYVKTTVENDDFAYGGSRPVTFTFDNGKVEIDAAVIAPQIKAGEENRDVKSEEGYTTKAPSAAH